MNYYKVCIIIKTKSQEQREEIIDVLNNKQFGEENASRQTGLNFFGVYDYGKRYPDEERFARFDENGDEKYEQNTIMAIYAKRFNEAHEKDYLEIEARQQNDKEFMRLVDAYDFSAEPNLVMQEALDSKELILNPEIV